MNFTGTFKKSLQLWLIAAIVFVIMLILNFHVGLISDDFFISIYTRAMGLKPIQERLQALLI